MADINILAASFSLPMHDFQPDVTSYGGEDLSPDHFSPGYENSQSSGMTFDQGQQQQQQQGTPQDYIDTYSFDSSYLHQREQSKHGSYVSASTPTTTNSISHNNNNNNTTSINNNNSNSNNTTISNTTTTANTTSHRGISASGGMFVEAVSMDKYAVTQPHNLVEDIYSPGFPGHTQDFYAQQQRYIDSTSKPQFSMDVTKSYPKHPFSEGSSQDLVFPQATLAYSDLEQKPTNLYGHGAYDPPSSATYCPEGPSLYQTYHPAFYGGQGAHCSTGMAFASPGVAHSTAYRSDISLSMSTHHSPHLHHSHRRTTLTIPTPLSSDR